METLDHPVAQLAHLLHQRNALDIQIARLIHRPAYAECLGKFIAAQVFDVRLLRSNAHPDIDGHFLRGPLAGRSLKVQWYSRQDGTLDLVPNASVNEYLVFTGSLVVPGALPDLTPAWVVEQVYLFDAAALTARLQSLGINIGPYTRLPQDLWEAAEIYPRACSLRLQLEETQIELLRLLGPQLVPMFALPASAGLPDAPTGAPGIGIPPVEEHLPAAPQVAVLPPAPQAEADVVPPKEFQPPSEPAATSNEAHPIAMRRWLTPPPAASLAPQPSSAGPAPSPTPLPVDLLADLLADSATAEAGAPTSAAGEAAGLPSDESAPAPMIQDTRTAQDLPTTARLPPLPPGAHFPRPSTLLSGEGAGAPRYPVPSRPTGALPKKYQPLGNYLRAVPPDLSSLTLLFAQIEEIIADRLPASAHKSPGWWSNEPDGKHAQAHSWLDNGWWIEDIDLDQAWVRLRRPAHLG